MRKIFLGCLALASSVFFSTNLLAQTPPLPPRPPASANNITYDNTTSGLAATNVQEALDELEATGGGGGGGNIILDLGNDGTDSSALTKIVTTNDTNSIFTEPGGFQNQLWIDMSQNWPTADTAAGLENGAISSVLNFASSLCSGGTKILQNNAGTWECINTPTGGGGGAGSDTTAIHYDTANEFANATLKGSPVSADRLLIEDSAAANAKKYVTIGTLPTGGGAGSDTTAIHVDETGEIAGLTLKGSPTTSDLLVIEDVAASNAKRKVTIGSLPGSTTTNSFATQNTELGTDPVASSPTDILTWLGGTDISVTGDSGAKSITIDSTATKGFAEITDTGGANTTAAMQVGTGASLTPTGSGVIVATNVQTVLDTQAPAGIDEADIQAAIDNCPEGHVDYSTSCTIILPAGIIDINSTVFVGYAGDLSSNHIDGTKSQNGFILRGQGRGGKSSDADPQNSCGTTLRWEGADAGGPVIRVAGAQGIRITSMCIDMQNNAKTTEASYAIQLIGDNDPSSSTGNLTRALIDNVDIFDDEASSASGTVGVDIACDTGNPATCRLQEDQVDIITIRDSHIVADICVREYSDQAAANAAKDVQCAYSGASGYQIRKGSMNIDGGDILAWEGTTGPGVAMWDGHGPIIVNGVHFENMNDGGAMIQSCSNAGACGSAVTGAWQPITITNNKLTFTCASGGCPGSESMNVIDILANTGVVVTGNSIWQPIGGVTRTGYVTIQDGLGTDPISILFEGNGVISDATYDVVYSFPDAADWHGTIDGSPRGKQLVIQNDDSPRIVGLRDGNLVSSMNQIWARDRDAGDPPTNIALLDLEVQAEAGGANSDAGGKTKAMTIRSRGIKNTPGENHGAEFHSLGGGYGDTIGLFVETEGTSASRFGGDESALGIRTYVRDVGGVTPVGTATFSGGSAGELISPGATLSKYEWDYVGVGQLIVWTDSPTAITITGYDDGTRTWTYNSPADTDFTGRCFAMDSMTYDDRDGNLHKIWLYVDGHPGSQQFTTEIFQASSGVPTTGYGVPLGYDTSAGAGSMSKACNRVSGVERDPNLDETYTDGTIAISGADWSGASPNFEANVSVGSCASNCTFEVAPGIPFEMIGVSAIMKAQQGVRQIVGYNAATLIEDAAQGDPGTYAVHSHSDWLVGHLNDNADSLLTGLKKWGFVNRTDENEGDLDALAKQIIWNQSGTDGWSPLIEVAEDTLTAGSQVSLGAELSGSSKYLTIGTTQANSRPIVTAPTSGSAGDFLVYGGGDIQTDYDFSSTTTDTVKIGTHPIITANSTFSTVAAGDILLNLTGNAQTGWRSERPAQRLVVGACGHGVNGVGLAYFTPQEYPGEPLSPSNCVSRGSGATYTTGKPFGMPSGYNSSYITGLACVTGAGGVNDIVTINLVSGGGATLSGATCDVTLNGTARSCSWAGRALVASGDWAIQIDNNNGDGDDDDLSALAFTCNIAFSISGEDS